MTQRTTRRTMTTAFLGCLLLMACGPRDDAPAARPAALGGPGGGYVPRGLPSKLFIEQGATYGPMDVDAHALHLTLDVTRLRVLGVSTIRFHQGAPSRPAFLLSGTVHSVLLGGRAVAFRGHVQDPDGVNQLYAVEEDLPAFAPQELEVRYELPPRVARFGGGGVGLLFGMSDLAPVQYLEGFAPAGFEEDQFPLSLHVSLRGATSAHELFSNGAGGMRGDGEWYLEFPPTFTASSFYFHLTNQPLAARRIVYRGIEREIPITAYGQSGAVAEAAVAALPALFSELEADYGPYPHARFTAYLTGEGGGGMEHAGATVTSLRALGHELAHSWFARGVMPADGRAQWIDEGIVTWRDRRYPRAASLLAASPTRVGDTSRFQRGMPYVIHSDAARLMAEWDLLFAPGGGLRPMLRTLFQRYVHRVMTTAELRAFLEEESGVDLDAYFRRYVTGDPPRWPAAAAGDGAPGPEHPLPLTLEELDRLR